MLPRIPKSTDRPFAPTLFREPHHFSTAGKDLARLARALRQSRGPLAAEEVVDSQHIATAAIAGCRYLLTWNQKHLANPFIQKIIDNIIKGHGFQAPTLATPEQFLEAALD